MKDKVYNKLVRDKIIDIISDNGKKAEFHIVEGKEYQKYLMKKLYEEVSEFEEEPSIEEMADILEVIEALISSFSFDKEEINKVREQKVKERGSFKKGIILEKVIEE